MAFLIATTVTSTDQKPVVVFESEVSATTTPVVVRQLTTEEQIMKVFNSKRALKVAWCESNLKHYEKDGSVKRGKIDPRDVGLFQVNERYHLARAKRLGLNLSQLEGNIKYAKILYDENGWQDWEASRYCWEDPNVSPGK